MAAKVVDKKEKKQAILVAALQIFAKKGFAKTTISEIARAAGIGKGTVYEYFPTKEEIVYQSFRTFMRQLDPDFENILLAEITAKDKILQILDGFSHFMDTEEMLRMVELMFDFWSESIRTRDANSMIFQEMNKFYISYREIFADIIIEGMSDGSFRKDVNPKYLASVIIGALDGSMVQKILDPQNINYSQLVKTLSSVIIEGISPHKV